MAEGKNAEALNAELARLAEDLPKPHGQLITDQARHRPAVVEELIEKAWAMRAEGDRQTGRVADAARLVAAELPARFDREQRFTLRGRSLELWGTVRLMEGQRAEAEAALLCAFELLAQTESAEPSHLAVILGRLALVAADQQRRQNLARYAAEAVRVTKAADRERPLPTFLSLWKTVMSEPEQPASGVLVAKALFQAVTEAYGGFEGEPWEMSLVIAEGGDAGTEIRLEHKGLLPGMPDWTESTVSYCGGRPAAEVES